MGVSEKELLIFLTMGELLLCVVIVFGGYLIYNVSHSQAGTSINSPSRELQPTPTPPVTPSPVFTATPNPTFTPTVTPGPLQIVALDALHSYRLEARTVLEGWTLGTRVLTQNFLQEWNQEEDAHRIIADAFDASLPQATLAPGQFSAEAMESLQIGTTYWVHSPEGWLQYDNQQQPSFKNIGGVSLPTEWQSLKLVDEETVAGVHCLHYTVDEEIVPDDLPDDFFTRGHAQGDLWIASQTGLPAVILRAKLKVSMNKSTFYGFFPPSPTGAVGDQLEERPGIFQYEYEVKEVDLPVVIEPPA